MNDPSTLAAANHGDRDGVPTPTPEPTDVPHPEPFASPAPLEPPAPALHASPAVHAAPASEPPDAPRPLTAAGPSGPAPRPDLHPLPEAAGRDPRPIAVSPLPGAGFHTDPGPLAAAPGDRPEGGPGSQAGLGTLSGAPGVEPLRVAPGGRSETGHEPRAALQGAPAAEPDPAPQPAAPHPEPLRTLLETAATCRPVEEVTALVGLLKDSGRLANPGHDALRAAAVARPVEEVRRMVALLGEHPDEEAEADITLRAAAIGRPIEDVALLATILDPEGPDAAPAARPAARTAATADPAAGPDQPPAGVAAPPPDPAPQPPQPPPVRATVPVAAPTAADAIAARAARRGGVLGHVLRWPTAAALLLCGVLHLPGNLAQPPEPGRLVPLAVALLCLPLGALLAVRDTPAVWRGAAVATLAVVALHIAGGVAYFNPLDGTLGAPYPWAGVATVLAAGTAAILSGVALTYRPPRPRTDEGA